MPTGNDNIISSAGAGVPNESIIKSSSLPGFTPSSIPAPQSIQEAKSVTVKPELNMKDFDNVVKDVKSTRFSDKDSVEAAKVFKLLLSNSLQPFKAQDFVPGSMLFYRYDAKYKDNTYDKSPLTIVLRKSKGYVLGLNTHWIPISIRLVLLKYILQANKNNIRNNMPLNITYNMLKPIIQRLNLGPVIRLYIFGRISRRGLVVPPSMWLSAAMLKAESFSNGQSAENLYKQALQSYAQKKATRGRRDKMF